MLKTLLKCLFALMVGAANAHQPAAVEPGQPENAMHGGVQVRSVFDAQPLFAGMKN